MRGQTKNMTDEKFKNYLLDLICLIKKEALNAKLKADDSKEENVEYNTGFLMAYHEVIAIMKHQAIAFNIDEKILELADIEPERDLL